MKKITFTAIAFTFLSITINAQTGAWKKFSLLNQSNSPQSGLQTATATISKTITTTIPEVIELGTPVTQPATKPKTLTTPPKLKREVTKDYSIFVLNGATSTVATTSIQAKFGFDGQANDTANIELYKLEVKDGNRIFSVLPGKTLATKISISFTADPSGYDPNSEKSFLTQVKISGYLTQGEYVFIDKASVSTDGTQINCYAFKIL